MRLSIGYQLPDENDSISEIMRDFDGKISSVYFAAPGQISARMAVDEKDDALMLEELRAIRDSGVSLTMLFNANCYGDLARSTELRDMFVKTTRDMLDAVGISAVTTTSPLAAKAIKENFPEIQTCASVNMWTGTWQAMEYSAAYFDEYYVQRELNRDFRALESLKRWADGHGKKLRLLANSGCLYTCPFHTFHDNLVSHERGAADRESAMGRRPSPCWDYMDTLNPFAAAGNFLASSWIRPDDIHQYESLFDEVKLATRMHANPRRVVSAYARGKFRGNILDLTEPSFSTSLKGYILDSTLFPGDWFERTSNCSRRCGDCGYCADTAKKILLTKMELEWKYQSDFSSGEL